MFEQETQEMQEMQEEMYSPADMNPQPDPSIGDYPTLRGVASVLKEEDVKGPVDFSALVDESWRVANNDNILMDTAVLKESGQQGNVGLAAAAKESILQRSGVSNVELSNYDKLLEITKTATDKFASSQPKVFWNSTPEAVVNASNSASKDIASAVSLEKRIEDASTFASWAGFGAKTITPFLFTAQNVAVQNVVKKHLGEGSSSYATGHTEDVKALAQRWASLPDEEKTPWLESVYNDLRKNAYISDVYAGMMVSDIIKNAPRDGWDKSFDFLDKVGVPLDILGVGLALRASNKFFNAAKVVNEVERSIAKVGGKSILVGKDAAMLAAKGVAEPLKELSGWNTLEAIGKLTSASVKNILPAHISTAPTEVQGIIKSRIEKTLTDLQGTLGANGKVVDDILEIRKVYDPATNPTVARLDFDGGGARVWFKPAGLNAFSTPEAAEGWRLLADPDGKLGLKVVPDTTNPGHLVEAQVLKEKASDVAIANVKLKEAVDEVVKKSKGRKAKKEAVAKVSSAFPKSLDEEVQNIFKANPDIETPNMAKEGDILLYKHTGADVWSTDKDVVLAAAKASGGQMRAIAVPKEKAASFMVAPAKSSIAPSDDAAFAKWFGESVVTENGKAGGKPLVVYHGTDKDFSAFDASKQDPVDGGFWFGSKRDAGNYVAFQRPRGENIMPVYLSIKNPKVYYNRDVKITPALVDRLTKEGYDGVLRDFAAGPDAGRYGADATPEWAAFRPEQIKSAIGNNGKFDLNNPDIRFNVSAERLADLDAVETPVISPTAYKSLNLSLLNNLLDGAEGHVKLTNNISVSSTLATDPIVTEFLRAMTKPLGMENQRMVIVQWQDWMKNGNLEPVATKYAQMYPSSRATYNRLGNVHLIIMKRPKGNTPVSVAAYAQDFAHEYAHAFTFTYVDKYDTLFKAPFEEFLKRKGRPLAKYMSLSDILHYRSTSMSFDTFNLAAKNDGFADLLRGRPVSDSENMRRWFGDWHEFLAEGFSEWAFTDKVPTTLLGKAFTSITDTIALIYNSLMDNVAKAFGRPVSVTNRGFYNAFLNEHIRKMEAGEIDQALEGAGKTSPINSTVAKLADDVSYLTEDYKAALDASEGLPGGYLVEGTFAARRDVAYDPEDVSSVLRFNLGDWALGTSSEQYGDRLVGTYQVSRYRKILLDYVRKPLESLSSKERMNVDSVLRRGDAEGREYAYSDLLALGLNNKEVVGYMTFRGARNLTYQLRNGALSKSLMDRGYHTLNHPAMPPVFGRAVEIGKSVGNAYDADTGRFVRVSESWWQQNPGKVAFELNEPGEFGGKHAWYVVGTTTSINQTSISNAIPYRVGEYSRKYTDNYFIKYGSVDWLHKDGNKWLKATRTSTSKVEGEKYVAAFNEGLRLHRSNALSTRQAASLMEPWGWQAEDFIAELNKLPPDVSLSVVATRTEDDYIREGINLGMGTGGARGEHIQNVRGNDNTLSPMDSLAAEISNASFVASTTEWRDNHIKLWYNTFHHLLPENLKGMKPEDAFFERVNSKQGRYPGADKERVAMQRVQDYLLQQLNVPSQEERYFQGFSRMLAESVEGENVPSLLLGKALRATSSWPKFMRTVAFHSFFGFNPVQVLVQSMNAFNAIAISPLHGVKAGSMMPLYRVALMSDNEDIWRNVAKSGKLVGMSEEEFVLTVKSIRRSGLLDGINSTSLYGAETGSLSLFNRGVRTAATGSTFFFNRGEEAARLISWDIAKREWVKANPTGAWWEDDAMRVIMERQDDLTQNMTVANTAFWQKGALSVPLQFFQYPVKLMMNLLASTFTGSHRAFTRPEVMSLLSMHLIFLGTAGNWTGKAVEEVLGDSLKDMTAEQRLYVQQGVAAGVINSVSLATTDEKLELGLGSRLGTFNFYEDFVDSLLDPEKPFLAMLSGASGGAFARALDNYSKAISLYVAAPMDADVLEEAAKMMLTGSLSVANNYEKALLASSWDAVLSKSGNQMYSVNNKERFMMKWGIPPAAQADLSLLFTNDKKVKDWMKKEAALIGNLRERSLLAIKEGDHEKAKSLYAVIRVRIDGVPDPNLRLQLETAALAFDTTTKQKKLLMEIIGEQFKGGLLVNPNPAEVR